MNTCWRDFHIYFVFSFVISSS